jgi:hypothetical protein
MPKINSRVVAQSHYATYHKGEYEKFLYFHSNSFINLSPDMGEFDITPHIK